MNILRKICFLINRIRLALSVLRKGLPKEHDISDKIAVEIISGKRKPGLPCPRCRSLITVDISALLTKSNVYCSECGLELKMDWQEDSRARKALQNLQATAFTIEKSRQFKG